MYNFIHTYKDFPKWTDSAEGMVTLPGDFDHTAVYIAPPVTYGTKDDYPLHIRFVVPVNSDDTRKYPLIIHCKGSGWEKQNLEGNIGHLYDIIKAGYMLAVVEYRPWQRAKYPGFVADLKSAAAWILENRDTLPIDIDNVFLSGDSSGGHTAIMAYLTWGQDVLCDDDKPLPKLKGLLDFFGVTDVKKLTEVETGLSQADNALLIPMLFDDPQDIYTASSSCYMDLLEDLPPVLILHGNKDRMVPLFQSVEFYNNLKARGCEAEFYMIEGADHSGLSFWSQPTKETILNFLRKHTR